MRICTTCAHPQRAEIDRALATGAGARRRIAAQYGLAETSLRRHEGQCLDPKLIEAHNRSLDAEIDSAKSVILEVVRDLREDRRACRHVNREQYESMVDRLIKANEQWARINREIGADQLNAFFVSIGAANEGAVRQAWELSRSGKEITPEEAWHDAGEVEKMLAPQVPHLIHRRIRDLQQLAESLGMLLPAHTENGNGRAEVS